MKNTDWTPCKEKMPEKFEAVLVTLKNKTVVTARYMSNKFMKITEQGFEDFKEENPVIAWIKLPTPYDFKEEIIEPPTSLKLNGRTEYNQIKEIFENRDIAKNIYDFSSVKIRIYLDSYTKEKLSFLNNSKDAKSFIKSFKCDDDEMNYDHAGIDMTIRNAKIEITGPSSFIIIKNNKEMYIDIFKDSGLDTLGLLFNYTTYGKMCFIIAKNNNISIFEAAKAVKNTK